LHGSPQNIGGHAVSLVVRTWAKTATAYHAQLRIELPRRISEDGESAGRLRPK
jgi:hypothetical protein